MVILRESDLLSSGIFNVDEGTLLAWGRLAKVDLIPYRTYTVSDIQFLWPIFLGILGDLHVHLTLMTAHIISGLCYAFLIAAGWIVFQQQHGWKLSTAIILPPALYLFAGFPSLDFLSLGTELLPIVLIMAGALVVFALPRNVSLPRLAVGSFLAGASVWAKPQLGPLALAFVISAVLVRTLEQLKRRRTIDPHARMTFMASLPSALIAMAAFVAPSIAALLWIVVTGGWHSFLKESLGFISNETGNVPRNTASGVGPRAESVGTFVIEFPLVVIWIFGGLIGWADRKLVSDRGLSAVQWIAWVLPVAASIATFFALGHIFGHYGNIFYAGALVSGIVGCRIARLTEPPPDSSDANLRTTRVLIAVFAPLVVLSIAYPLWTNVRLSATFVADVITNRAIPQYSYYYYGFPGLSSACPPGSRVQVWGWNPELYEYYDWIPATRYVNTDYQLEGTADARYYRSTFVDELSDRPPRCIIEIIGPRFANTFSQSDTLTAIVPRATGLIHRCYQARSLGLGSDATSPEYFQSVTVYVRRGQCATKL